MTEAEWQQQVIDLVHLCGWKHMHARRSIGKGRKWTTALNVTGWPDLTLWKPGHGFVFVELKSDTGWVTPEQREVLASLAAAGGEVHVWRPCDLDEAKRVLNRRVAA